MRPQLPPTFALHQRLAGLALLAITLTPLLMAAGLQANPAGHGTHTQLGLTPCGFLAATGSPCATCGMTTAFTHVAHGQWISAAAVQPAGTLLALICAMGVLVGGHTVATGMRVTALLQHLIRSHVVLPTIAIVLLAWLYTAVRMGWPH
ncbi:MAG: DUF2752 domain-containing protein [Algisphaera sp.]